MRSRNRWTEVTGTAAAVAACLGLSGCASVGPTRTEIPTPATLQSTVRFQKEYLLAPDDQIEVAVRGVQEASRVVIVRPDGAIALPLLGDVPAAGRTPRALAAHLTELFSKRLLNPEVNVMTLKVRQPVVFVTGEVNNPVVVPLRDAPTAAQAVAYAGGFRRTAAGGSVAILRLASDGRLQAIPASGQVDGQTGRFLAMRMAALEADDIVFVPESGRSQFARILDDFVNRPLGGLNAAFMGYVNYRYLQDLNKNN
jgi:protein involved in polysaccharide export with SLBB domain